MTTVCFLWHMHQPFYKDLWSGEYKLPWTRLHAMKDYAGMVEILAEFPAIHQTFNLVPSMVAQIEEYESGKASDPFLDCALARAEDLGEAHRNFVLKYFFQANFGRLISRYPRYLELYGKQERKENFSAQDLRDLQIFHLLVWFDEDLLARDPELIALIGKGRDFSLSDQRMIARKQREALARVLPVYREFGARGQIEISTTPFYHPILPLICDSDLGAVSSPGLALPPRFVYPDDARVQLDRARSYIFDKLGVAPVGLWPSEGSVSDEALALAAHAGFTWAASDNGVLARTLNRDAGVDATYRAYRWQQNGHAMRMIFRDRYLSDLIGFEYSRMNAQDAAGHFHDRIRQNSQERKCLVPIILDGENAWEWYEANGRPFLRELYRRISEDPTIEALTVSEALAKFEAEPLHGIFPGSWINANFNVWIGAEEDNQAWALLLAARRAYDETPDVPESARKLAYEELLIAEGSDWNWWYGPEHGSDNRPEFDQLYRDHLMNVYRALGLVPPEALSRSILHVEHSGEIHDTPRNSIHVTLDGEVTSYFEWMGAGRYRPDPRSGAMHGAAPPIWEMFYGCDGQSVVLRLDGLDKGVTVEVEFENGIVPAEIASGRVTELRAPLAGHRLRVNLSRNGLPVATLPMHGWFEVGECMALMKTQLSEANTPTL
ncbi:MAG TPA: glycoside hydrolase family 57 protein [Bryobacteraceae bacterium]|nr:glycoside hydrolase family 57 protein [Bryobacteraceae bacterium]